MGTKNGRRKALHAKRKGPNTPPCFTHDCIAPGGLWQGLNRLLKVEAAGLMLPHSTFPVTPERQGTLSWPSLPLRLESQSPLRLYSIGSGHFRTSVTGWAQRLQASCRLRGGCQERSLACRYTAVVPVLLFSARQIGTTRLSAANK